MFKKYIYILNLNIKIQQHFSNFLENFKLNTLETDIFEEFRHTISAGGGFDKFYR